MSGISAAAVATRPSVAGSTNSTYTITQASTQVAISISDVDETHNFVLEGLARGRSYHTTAWALGTDGNWTLLGTIAAKTNTMKEPYIASTNGTFAVSEVSPQPAESEASFSIETAEAGTLNVKLYNYAGSMLRHIVAGMHIDADAEITVPLNIEDLSSGVYTLEILLNGDKVVRNIVIRK